MTTPTTPYVALPGAMIEAAARAYAEHDVEMLDRSIWDELGSEDRDEYREAARRGLAAALGVCEVREQHGHAEDEHVVGSRWHDHRCPTASLRHLVITTPAEPDPTVGQP